MKPRFSFIRWSCFDCRSVIAASRSLSFARVTISFSCRLALAQLHRLKTCIRARLCASCIVVCSRSTASFASRLFSSCETEESVFEVASKCSPISLSWFWFAKRCQSINAIIFSLNGTKGEGKVRFVEGLDDAGDADYGQLAISFVPLADHFLLSAVLFVVLLRLLITAQERRRNQHGGHRAHSCFGFVAELPERCVGVLLQKMHPAIAIILTAHQQYQNEVYDFPANMNLRSEDVTNSKANGAFWFCTK